MREELAEEKTVWVVPEAYAGVRIDKALSAYQPEISRSFWQKLLAEKRQKAARN